MKKLLITAASIAVTVGAAHAAPATVTLLPGYDSTFPGRCGGSPAVDCEQAVGEFRRGDNGATAAEREAGLGTNTVTSPADAINITGNPGFWDGQAYAFALTYDAVSDLLQLSLDVDRNSTFGAAETMDFTVDLGPTSTMYIRAAGQTGVPVELNALTLDGMALSIPSFSTDSNSYLEIADFNWNADWALAGNIIMDGTTGSSSRPSVQFKLTDLPPNAIPVPAGAWLFGSAAAAGLARLRKKRA